MDISKTKMKAKEIKKTAKEFEKTAKDVADKVMKDPLTKEIIEDEKEIAKKAIGKAAKRIQDKL